jgi:hypothetical protein
MMEERSKTRQRKPSGVKEIQRLRAVLDHTKRRIQELAEEREADRREIEELRLVVAEQAEQLEVLLARVELVTSREEELRAMLLGAHDQLMRRAEMIKAELQAELQQSVSQPDATLETHSLSQSHGGQSVDYPGLVGQIREVAKAVLPPGATVVVVSKGDEELLKLDGERIGWHFPQNENGVYAGFYPADGSEAIFHLEELRAKGADFLLFPETAFWWLERYRDFKQHLDSHYRRIWSEGCIIYQLYEMRPDDTEAQ